MDKYIRLHHGDGGKHTNDLINQVFYKHFNNPILAQGQDAAVLPMLNGKPAFTTDSFVVKPTVFQGGNIGKLAICGTINDLVAVGAEPLYISAGFIIEEGFEMELLDEICCSMGRICKDNKVKIVTGDTKVVEKGAVDGIFINTAGIGRVQDKYKARELEPGDEILITGGIAEHGTVILTQRYNLDIGNQLESDCNPLCDIITALKDDIKHVKLMRDPTRGGLATALCEIAQNQCVGMVVHDAQIPIHPKVQAVHSLLGTDPLYFASEGRMIMVVEKGYSSLIKQKLQAFPIIKDIQTIGKCVEDPEHMVRIKTEVGGMRIVTMLENQMIPRIC